MIVALAFSHVAAYLAGQVHGAVQTKGDLGHGGRNCVASFDVEDLGPHAHD
jgi:hypothetical protein